MSKENTRLFGGGCFYTILGTLLLRGGGGPPYETSLIFLFQKNLAHNISEKAPGPKNQHICHIGGILDNTSYSALKKQQNRHISVGKHPIMKIKALYFLQLLKLKKKSAFSFGIRVFLTEIWPFCLFLLPKPLHYKKFAVRMTFLHICTKKRPLNSQFMIIGGMYVFPYIYQLSQEFKKMQKSIKKALFGHFFENQRKYQKAKNNVFKNFDFFILFWLNMTFQGIYFDNSISFLLYHRHRLSKNELKLNHFAHFGLF